MFLNLHLQRSHPVYYNRDCSALCWSKAAVTFSVESLSFLTDFVFLFLGQFVFQSFNTSVTVVQEFKKAIVNLCATRICELPGWRNISGHCRAKQQTLEEEVWKIERLKQYHNINDHISTRSLL